LKKPWISISFVLGVLLGTGIVRSQQSAAGTQRIVQFENDDVKLKGGTMRIVEQSGASGAHVWDTGKAYWLPANAPGTMHADVNAGDQPIEVMVVELKKNK
jgi:hypothetical protein